MSILNWLGFTSTSKREQLDAILNTKVNEMKAYTQPMNDGRTGLFKTDGTMVSSFARSRDAVRGATRRGFTLIN